MIFHEIIECRRIWREDFVSSFETEVEDQTNWIIRLQSIIVYVSNQMLRKILSFILLLSTLYSFISITIIQDTREESDDRSIG